MVVPEVNPEAIGQYVKRGIVANPNCSTIQMLVAVKPLHDEATVRRITVSTYQAVAGSGNRAIEELATLSAKRLSGSEDVRPEVYPVPIAFNAIPHIDCVSGQRVYEGGDEDGLGDAEDFVGADD